MIGIYKITSPRKKVYIGQSVNIKKRFKQYINLICKKQIKLYNSFLKYGVDNHKFEILCECEINELNDKERYYQDLYCVLNEKGLNCVLTNSSDRNRFGLKHTDEAKLKMSLAQVGRIFTEDYRNNMSRIKKGTKHSVLAIENMKKAQYGKIISDAQKVKMSLNNFNSKIVLDTETGIFYKSASEVSKIFNLNINNLRYFLGIKYNKDYKFIYV